MNSMRPPSVQLKKLDHGQDMDLPFYATPGSAGMDLMAAITEPVALKPRERTLIPCGISLAIPQGYEAQIRPRSGLAFKQGLTVLNTPGTIDSDYRGEIKVILINLGQEVVTIDRGMRVAQMIIAPYTQVDLKEVSEFREDLLETTRSKDGFGSTGLFAIK
ncbi:MAG TPA: dUTP diphosphatase [Holosporales bacterium]|nr:dUTP diphosphatase [Holosporales bacterium]